jgi:hypothetical protein
MKEEKIKKADSTVINIIVVGITLFIMSFMTKSFTAGTIAIIILSTFYYLLKDRITVEYLKQPFDLSLKTFKITMYTIIIGWIIIFAVIASLFIWRFNAPDNMAKTMYKIGQPLQNSRFKVVREIGKVPTGIVKEIERTIGSQELSIMQEKLHNLSSQERLNGFHNGTVWMEYARTEPTNKYGQLYTFKEYKQLKEPTQKGNKNKLDNRVLSIAEQLKEFDKVSSKLYLEFQSNKKKMQQIYYEDTIKWEQEYYNKLSDKNKLLAKKTISQYSSRFKGANKIYVEDKDTNNMVLWIVISTLDIVSTKHSLKSVEIE